MLVPTTLVLGRSTLPIKSVEWERCALCDTAGTVSFDTRSHLSEQAVLPLRAALRRNSRSWVCCASQAHIQDE